MAVGRQAQADDLNTIIQHFDSSRDQHHLALLHLGRSGPKAISYFPSYHVQVLDCWITDHKTTAPANRDNDLDPDRHRDPGPQLNVNKATHHLLHRQGAGRGTQAVLSQIGLGTLHIPGPGLIAPVAALYIVMRLKQAPDRAAKQALSAA